ncbi:MAG: PGF-pre-PGF domain-containing protein, partial [Nanoarchaeota archaeon]
ISLAKGNQICWYYFANETSGNIWQSENYCFNVVNTVPVFDLSLASQSKSAGQTLTYDINCSDVDGDTITYYDDTSLFNINISSGLISHNPSNNDAGTHTVNITCGDGESNLSQSFSYAISATAASAAVAGSSSSPGGLSSALSKEAKTIDLRPNLPSSVSFSKDLGITEVAITSSSDRSVSITVQQVSASSTEAVGAGRPINNIGVYKYINIKSSLDNKDIQRADLTFKIPYAWFSGVFDKSKVSLYHYKEGWKKLPTKKIKEDGSFVYYQSQTDSLSLFAISAERIIEKDAAPAQGSSAEESFINETVTEEIIGLKTVEPAEPAYQRGVYLIDRYFIFIAPTIALIIAAVFIFRFRKHIFSAKIWSKIFRFRKRR